VQDFSYSSTGFDRGHNTPSGDRTNTIAANSATFLMTNMIPQAPYHNQIVWAGMEDSLRRLVTQGNELYIIMGNYGTGGTGNNGFTTTIDAGRVTVPSNIWKIAIVIPNGDNDSSRVNNNTRVIAVDIPNTNTLFSTWKSYRTSVDAIEAATGYDLISRLPASLQAVLEARVDNL
jgi:endonuclease G